MRVHAVATKRVPASDFSADGDLLRYASELTFRGLVGIIDPPRPEARDAIALCRRAASW